MKLTQLEYFCVAARYHNITRASKELFVTQPSMQMQSDLNFMNSGSRSLLSVLESLPCLEPFICRICIFL